MPTLMTIHIYIWTKKKFTNKYLDKEVVNITKYLNFQFCRQPYLMTIHILLFGTLIMKV